MKNYIADLSDLPLTLEILIFMDIDIIRIDTSLNWSIVILN